MYPLIGARGVKLSYSILLDQKEKKEVTWGFLKFDMKHGGIECVPYPLAGRQHHDNTQTNKPSQA